MAPGGVEPPQTDSKSATRLGTVPGPIVRNGSEQALSLWVYPYPLTA
jgi:hypothetical protein